MKKVVKSIYGAIPFKKQLFLFLKLFWGPSKKIYRHLYFTGDFKVRVDDSHSFRMKHFGFEIENDIFWCGLKGGWEKMSIQLWAKLCKHSAIVFDIGANTGLYSLVAKASNPKSKIYAFEPVQRVYDKLRQNIVLNNSDIIAVKMAASDSDGFAKIYDTDNAHTLSVAINKNLLPSGTKANEVQVETVTLDSFIEKNNIQKVDAIKIDVETHEPQVLEGFKKHLSYFKPSIIIEILNDEIGRKIMQQTADLDYLYFNIDDIRGSVRQVTTLTKSDYFNYLLCGKETAKELGLLN